MLYRMQRGRYYVALSLPEAEALRGALHIEQVPLSLSLSLGPSASDTKGIKFSLGILGAVFLHYFLFARQA